MNASPKDRGEAKFARQATEIERYALA